LFDDLGRISESGQAHLDSVQVSSRSGNHIAVRNMVNRARKEEVVHMYYDKPINSTTNSYFAEGGQKLLRNRVSSTVFTENIENDPSIIIPRTGDILGYNNATHYSYDYHGNVKTLIQENRDPILIERGQSRKRIDYDYDLISGKTNRVCYQCDSTDQFIHKYMYDADNRITGVNTGTQSDRLQHDAKYIFYKHGPVARIDLGDRLVQGIDYAYTLQGWLKGINSNTAIPRNDMGGDGGAGSPFASDRYGFSLQYFTNDYMPIAPRDAAHSFLARSVSSNALSDHLTRKSLFDGNISSTSTTINDVSGPGALLHLYSFDQLQRIKTSNSYVCLDTATNAWGIAGVRSYGTSYSYDPNGNITNLIRSAGANQYDNLTYAYPLADYRLQNNKLRTVTENASPRSLSGAGDINSNINYIYDYNGNITRENSTELRWTATGRIKQYGINLHYAYDAAQRRVKKTDANSTQFYVYDLTGNILAFYTFRDRQLVWSGSPIYGTSRLGMYHANKVLPSTAATDLDTLRRGKTEYELTNHLGDVLATITDKKLTRTGGSSTYMSDIKAAQEYLPFGMQMPGRTYSTPASTSTTAGATENYPFAYNGMERDKKDGADGYTTEFRQYDSRIGRWKSVDPKTEKTNSYYDGFGNNPIALNDVRGDAVQVAPAAFAIAFGVGAGISIYKDYQSYRSNQSNNRNGVNSTFIAQVGARAALMGVIAMGSVWLAAQTAVVGAGLAVSTRIAGAVGNLHVAFVTAYGANLIENHTNLSLTARQRQEQDESNLLASAVGAVIGTAGGEVANNVATTRIATNAATLINRGNGSWASETLFEAVTTGGATAFGFGYDAATSPATSPAHASRTVPTHAESGRSNPQSYPTNNDNIMDSQTLRERLERDQQAIQENNADNAIRQRERESGEANSSYPCPPTTPPR